jgi:hypothetical protein
MGKPGKVRGCPQCRHTAIDWTEWWKDSIIVFDQDANGIDPVGYLREGDPYKVTGECRNCGHVWTAKGARQITHLPGHPDFQRPGEVSHG